MNKILVISLLALSFNVFAQESKTLTWTNATLNTDGSPFTDLDHTNMYYGVCDAGAVPATPTVVDVGTGESWDSPILDVGDWCFEASHVNSQSEESDRSTLLVVTIQDTVVPQPPTNLTVSPSNLTAYTYSISIDKLVMIPVGTVLDNTPCDSTMSMNGYYRVDRDVVDYVGTIEPPVVFAECI
jgi:hypothetical protein